jgi:hypothetical protein
MSVELHPTVLRVPPSHHELLTATGVSFRFVKQPTTIKLFLAMFFTTGPAFDTLYHRSI